MTSLTSDNKTRDDPGQSFMKQFDEFCAKEAKVNDIQIAGDHYKRLPIQPWDYVLANDLDYFQGSIIKYVSRWKLKGGIQDLEKAKHFLDKYIEASR